MAPLHFDASTEVDPGPNRIGSDRFDSSSGKRFPRNWALIKLFSFACPAEEAFVVNAQVDVDQEPLCEISGRKYWLRASSKSLRLKQRESKNMDLST